MMKKLLSLACLSTDMSIVLLVLLVLLVVNVTVTTQTKQTMRRRNVDNVLAIDIL